MSKNKFDFWELTELVEACTIILQDEDINAKNPFVKLLLVCLKKLAENLLLKVNKMQFTNRFNITITFSELDLSTVNAVIALPNFEHLSAFKKLLFLRIQNPSRYENQTNKKGLPKRSLKRRI